MDRVGVDRRIALGDAVLIAVGDAVAGRQRLGRHARRRGHGADHPVVAEVVGEVRHLDHQHVAFPVPARHAHRLADVRVERRAAVERDRAVEVALLVEDDDVPGLLQDLIADHRRGDCGARDAWRQAQHAAVEVFDLFLLRDDVLASRQRLGLQRDLAIRRIHPHRPHDRALRQLRPFVQAERELAVGPVRRAVRQRHQRRLDAARQRDGEVEAGDIRLPIGRSRRNVGRDRAGVGRIGRRGRRRVRPLLRATDTRQAEQPEQRAADGDRRPHVTLPFPGIRDQCSGGLPPRPLKSFS